MTPGRKPRVRRVAIKAPRRSRSRARALALCGLWVTGLPVAHAPPLPAPAAATLSVVSGHRAAITALKWSRDETLLVSASGDNTAKVWDVATGALVRTLTPSKQAVRGLGNAVQAVSIIEDEHAVLVGSSIGLEAHDLRRKLPPSTIEPTSESVVALATAERGSTIITAGDGAVRSGARLFLRVRTSLTEPARELAHEGIGAIKSLALSPDDEWLLAGGTRIVRQNPGGIETAGAVYLYSMRTGVATRFFDDAKSRDIDWVAFAANARDLYLLSEGQVHRFDRASHTHLRAFPGTTAAVTRDGARLVTSADATSADAPAPALTVWDTATGAALLTLPWPTPDSERTRSSIETLQFSPSGRQLAVGLSNGKLAIWNFAAGNYQRLWEPRTQAPSKLQVVDASGERALTTRGRVVTLWDLRSGAPAAFLGKHDNDLTAIATSTDGTRIATAMDNGAVNLWDGTTGAFDFTVWANMTSVSTLAFSADATQLFTGGYAKVRVWRLSDGQLLKTIENDFVQVNALAVSPRGDRLAIGDDLGTVQLFSLPNFKWQFTLPAPAISPTVRDVAFDPKGTRLIVGYGNGHDVAVIYDLENKSAPVTLQPHHSWVSSVAFDPTGRRAVTGSYDENARLWDGSTGQLIRSFEHQGDVLAAGFVAGGTQLITFADEAAHLWDLRSEAPPLDLVSLADERWAVVAPDGRFDARSVEETGPLSWLMRDDPLRPLSFDLFMRDFYEPRLLARLTDCRQHILVRPDACATAFEPVRPLAVLNRTLPKVKILGIRPADTTQNVWVDLKVEPGHDPRQRNGKIHTDAYDLKLFRNGQRVGQYPAPRGSLRQYSTSSEALALWRAERKVVPPANGVISLPVHLPTQERGKPVTFTAYALNEDRIKSPTQTDRSYKVPLEVVPRRPRAYVIAIGVNAYENARRNLTYAVNDATFLASALKRLPSFEVVPVLLASDYVRAGDPHSRNINHATKDNIRALLQRLAGRALASGELRGVPGIAALKTATPDDIVIITFSGHGDTGPNGNFYLLASDSGADAEITAATRRRLISTDDLAEWLDPLDASQIALIIDACHAAQSVRAGEFKPGPMGDRGFGQLSYDKGMRILAATQPDDFAFEGEDVEQGLLTSALRQGLTKRNAVQYHADLNADDQVTLSEWLKFAEQRVPHLYAEIARGQVKIKSRDPSFDPRMRSHNARRTQMPSFFDFARSADDLVIARSGEPNRSGLPERRTSAQP